MGAQPPRSSYGFTLDLHAAHLDAGIQGRCLSALCGP